MHEPGQVSPDNEAADVQLWQRWRQGERSDVVEFLSDFPDLDGTEVVAALLVDQRERWLLGERVPAESYLRRFPALENDAESLVELVYGEYLLREERGERPRLDEYLWRFPCHQNRLRLQVECHQALQRDGTMASLSLAQATLPRAPEPVQGAPLLPGYEVLKELGRGGMGVVYKARQLKADRVVALKVILVGGHASAAEVERFHREAEAIARLQHPNIVQVFEVGEHLGLPYFSLEFCAGGSLDHKLAGRPLPAVQAALLLERLALAAQAAHEKHIVHRDLKPANVLLTEDGTPRISDFGLARMLDVGGQTQPGALLGTPSYMAPEQARGNSGEAEATADVYALGALLYECLTGRPPFKATTYAETVRQVLEQEPVPPRRLNAAVPRDLETICLKCLRKEPENRYASAAALTDDLRRFLEDRPITARRVAHYERTWRWCRRNPVVAALSSALLLFLTATAVAGIMMSVRLNNALGQSQKAQLEGKRKLFESHVADADAKRMSGRPGQRFVSLQLIHDALQVGDEIGLDEADRLRLRNVAIAALCLPDIELGLEWPAGRDKPWPQELDPIIRRAVQARYACERLPPPAHWMDESIEGSYSSDGRFLAVYGGGWDFRTKVLPRQLWRIDRDPPELLLGLDAEGAPWDNVAFRPDNRQVAFGHGDGTVSLYDLPTGKLIRRLKVSTGYPHYLGYHPYLPRLVVSGGNEVAIWDVEKGQRLRKMTHQAEVEVVAWHPRGHRLAVGCNNGEIHLWDAEKGQEVTAPWRGPPTRDTTGMRLAFNRAGDRVVSNNWSRVLRLWDAGSGKLLLSKPGGADPDKGTLCFASDDQSLGLERAGDNFRLLRVAGGQELRSLHRSTPQGPEPFEGFCLHPNGRLLAATTPAGLVFFDLLHGEDVGFVPGSFSGGPRFDSTGALWTAGSAGLLRWPVKSEAAATEHFRIGPPEWVADVLRDEYDRFSISDDGRVAAVSRHNSGALVVHLDPLRRTVPLGPQYDVREVFLSPDGRWVVSGSHWIYDNSTAKYKVWDSGTGKLIASLPQGEVSGVQGFSPDSRWLYVTGKADRRLDVGSLLARAVQDPPTGDEKGVPVWQEGWRSEDMRQGGVFSPDKALRAYGSEDGSIRLVTPDTDREVARFPSPEVGRISPRGFSPDGRFLLTLGEETGSLHVFDLRRIREQLAELGLDWAPAALAGLPKPTPAPPLQVELVDAEWAGSAARMTEYEGQGAVARLFVNPFDAEAHLLLGRRELEIGNNERAHAHLGAALAFRRDLDEALYPRCVAAFRLQRWADTEADASRCLEKWPFHQDVRYLRARAYRMLKQYEKAVADCNVLMQTDSYQPLYHELRGDCRAALGSLDLAVEDYLKAVKLLPDDGNPWSQRNRICGSLALREEMFGKAVEISAEDGGLWLARGRHLARLGQWKKAAAAYARATELASTDKYEFAWLERAAVSVLAGDLEGYARISRRAQEVRTEDPANTYILARTCLLAPTSKGNALEAVRLAERALQVAPQNGDGRAAALHVVGLAYYRAGDSARAVTYLNESLKTAPGWLGSFLNWPVLALAHHRQDHSEEALVWWRKSRARFERGNRDLAQEPIGFPQDLDPGDWLEFRALYREAEALLVGKKGEPGK